MSATFGWQEEDVLIDVRSLDSGDARALRLPPGLSHASPPEGEPSFAHAMRHGGELGAGTLVFAPNRDEIEIAIVLEPEEPMRTARRAFLLGLSAFVDALASVSPPDKPLTVAWPDTIRFDGARVGGARLGWPEGASEDAVPPFLVFGGSLILSKAWAGDPGLTPETTSLEEEAFEPGSVIAIVEAFARYLLRAVHAWQEETFEAAIADLLSRLRHETVGAPYILDVMGNLRAGGKTIGLAPALLAPSWLDPETGRVRL